MSNAPLLSRVLQQQADKEAEMARLLQEDGSDIDEDDGELREKDQTIEMHAMNQRLEALEESQRDLAHKIEGLPGRVAALITTQLQGEISQTVRRTMSQAAEDVANE